MSRVAGRPAACRLLGHLCMWGRFVRCGLALPRGWPRPGCQAERCQWVMERWQGSATTSNSTWYSGRRGAPDGPAGSSHAQECPLAQLQLKPALQHCGLLSLKQAGSDLRMRQQQG